MRAVVQDRYGLPDVLEMREVPTPQAGAGQVLLRVGAAGVNIGDWFVLRGEPLVLRAAFGLRRPRTAGRGFDVAGTVVAVGRDVTRWTPGDHLFGVGEASFADYAVVDEDALAPLPKGLAFEQAAALPIAGLTALQGLRDAASLQSGQAVLVNGASGGVGTFAVQVAHAMGATVTGVCSTRNVDLVASLGADHVIDYTVENVTRGDDRFDVVFDNVGNHPLSALRRVLAPTGTLLPNSGHGGRVLGPLPRMAAASLGALFSRQKSRTFLQTTTTADLTALADLVAAGDVVPVVDRTFDLADSAAALAHVGTGHARGKVVITV